MPAGMWVPRSQSISSVLCLELSSSIRAKRHKHTSQSDFLNNLMSNPVPYETIRDRILKPVLDAGDSAECYLHAVKEIRRVMRKDGLLALLGESLSWARRRQIELAKLSYHHENSFSKLTLAIDDSERFRVRIHWWRTVPGQIPTQANIHNHRFDFYSVLCHGSLTNTTWTLCDEGETFGYFHYKPRQGHPSYILEFLGHRSLSAVSQTTYETGNSYSQAARALHTTNVNTANLVTIFIEDRRHLRDVADVYSKRYEPRNIEIDSPSISPEAYIGQLKLLSALL